ncbi:TadE/TadG family type IV pilus assembly protein [Paenibacillus sp. FSL R7-0331]|uniref:TadE/TadG family type IV pilus assembly protein n=1 Tax=Paenibacillus sp. FSL R7-0331 TaxID=1536773 RepID=UPI0004F6A01E|nr:TadE family protein [Paenibacillus sp. FSL R7-0331]AIQ51081.1 pilus assembly protein TadE [Paenibacillus sp. FSL R7-0331]
MDLRSDEGSFTVEASLLLPIIMMITMLLLFFSLYTYQRTMLLQFSSATAERAAYNWDNSNKGTGGAFPAGSYDSLYWRIGEDGLLASLFGTGSVNGGVELTVPAQGAQGSLPKLKLEHSAEKLPANMTGEMSYSYNFSGRRISTELQRVLRLPVLDGLMEDKSEPIVKTQAVVTEPVEFIRTVELMRYYAAKFKNGKQENSSGTGMDKQEAGQMLNTLKK